MMNSEEQAERAGFDSLTESTKQFQKAGERLNRIRENGDELVAAARAALPCLYRLAEVCAPGGVGEAHALETHAAIRQVLAKIEGQP